jgi:hypothetical protein
MTSRKWRIQLQQKSGWHKVTRGLFTKSLRIQTTIMRDNNQRAYMHILSEPVKYVGAGGCEISTTLFLTRNFFIKLSHQGSWPKSSCRVRECVHSRNKSIANYIAQSCSILLSLCCTRSERVAFIGADGVSLIRLAAHAERSLRLNADIVTVPFQRMSP